LSESSDSSVNQINYRLISGLFGPVEENGKGTPLKWTSREVADNHLLRRFEKGYRNKAEAFTQLFVPRQNPYRILKLRRRQWLQRVFRWRRGVLSCQHIAFKQLWQVTHAAHQQ
jgi:hypothetical protein